MIEMLGVLAIIGVLSAGGVWGYNSAMNTYHANKFINDINTMSINAMNMFERQLLNKKNIQFHPKSLCDVGVALPEYCKNRNGDYVNTSFGGKMMYMIEFNVTATRENIDISKTNGVFYTRVTMPVNICKRILAHDWSKSMVAGAVYSEASFWQALPVSQGIIRVACAKSDSSELYIRLFFYGKKISG